MSLDLPKKKSTRQLEPFERETIIRWDRAGDEASVFTYEATWKSHFRKLGIEPEYKNGLGGNEYIIPKTWIRKPQKSRRKKLAGVLDKKLRR